MDPHSPSTSRPSLDSPQPPPEPELNPEPAHWTFLDLGLTLAFSVGAFASLALLGGVGIFIARAVTGREINIEMSDLGPQWAFGVQLAWWVLVFGFIYYVVAIKYRRPFLEGIGFRRFRVPPVYFVIAGFAAAVGSAKLGQLLGVPTDTSFEEVIKNANLLVLFPAVVLMAPLTEEMVFRGYVFPVIERSFGGWAAVGITSALFALIHGIQYDWAWQILVVLFLVGSVFGFARWRTGSVGPSVIMHAAYNGTMFAALAASRQLT